MQTQLAGWPCVGCSESLLDIIFRNPSAKGRTMNIKRVLQLLARQAIELNNENLLEVTWSLFSQSKGAL
jgi:hypothetical protein